MNESNIPQFNKITKADPDTVLLLGVGRGDDLPLFKQTYPKARFIGVEPLAEHLKMMKKRWLWSTSDLLPFALGSEAGERKLHCNYEPDQRATFYPMLTPLPDEDIRTVPVMTLDQVYEETQPWGERVLIWIDIEGAEAEVFGAISWGSKTLVNVKWINTELTFHTSRPEAALFGNTDAALQMLDFRLFAIHSLSRNCRLADAVYLPLKDWEDKAVAVSKMQTKRKQDRLARRTRLVRKRRIQRKQKEGV